MADAYTVGRALLDQASAALASTFAGTPDRRFVAMGTPVADVPDQLTVYLTGVTPTFDPSELVYFTVWNYTVQITRPYLQQPGDGGVVGHLDIDEASKVLYEDIDALVLNLLCSPPYGAVLENVRAVEPLGGVAGWTIDFSVEG